jgi:hypothetical protein
VFPLHPGIRPGLPFSALFISSLLGSIFLSLRNRNPYWSRRRYVVGCFAALLVVVVFLVSCGGFSQENVSPPAANTTPVGNYSVVVVATPSSGSGFIQSQLTVPLTVTQ